LTAQNGSNCRLWRFRTRATVELGSLVLILEGRLGHAAAAELEDVVIRHRGGAADIVVDLAGIDYISSAALRIFEALAERQTASGSRLRLRSPSSAARLALEFSGLETLVDLPSAENLPSGST
jgi:stage II sporulation protein AA (anti-sigma F factor antagonist)